MKDLLVATSFTIIQLQLPTIITSSFSLYMCFSYEDGHSYLRKDTSIRCWSGDHSTMAFSIGLSFIVVWMVIDPTSVAAKLYRMKGSFNDRRNLALFGIFYVGLNDHAFYWEILVVNFRKIILIVCAALMVSN